MTVGHQSITKKYGNIFVDYTKLVESTGAIIPTTLSLDIALCGGWQEGYIGFVSGNSKAGKSTLMLTIGANAQKMGKKIYWIDVEHRLGSSLLKTIPDLDTSPEKFQVIRSTQQSFLGTEDYVNIIHSLVSTEQNLFIVVDSVAALCANAVKAAEAGESKRMMSNPQMMYELLRKVGGIIANTGSSLTGITHVQSSPSMFQPYNEVGGKAWPFLSNYHICCLSSKEVEKDGKGYGRHSTFKIFKTALGPGTGEGKFYIRYGHGYDRAYDIFTLATELSLIEQKGAWFYYGEKKWQGQQNAIDYIRENQEFADMLEKTIREQSIPTA